MTKAILPCHVAIEEHTRIGHLFEHPLCSFQSLLEKIGNVALNIISLGIPLAIYKVLSYFYPNQFHGQNEMAQLRAAAIYSAKTESNKQRICDEAITFVEDIIRKPLPIDTSIEPIGSPQPITIDPIGTSRHIQPINRNITILYSLYWKEYRPAFFNALSLRHSDDPWSQKEVVEAADACMKIAFAISNMTLDELPVLISVPQKSEEAADEELSDLTSLRSPKTAAEILTSQSSYQYRTFYVCPVMYHVARGGYMLDKHHDRFDIPRDVSSAYANLFYQPGTIQYSWNVLYNGYCDRIRRLVKEEDLKNEDQRHVHWTVKDTGPSCFSAHPDTMPT